MVLEKVSAQILRLPLQKSVAVQVLEELLGHSSIHELQDLMVVARFPNEEPRLALAGRYSIDTDEAITALQFADRKLRWARSFQKG
jgi:hypothetical protein